MTALLLPWAGAPALYLSASRPADGVLSGFLLAPGTPAPVSLSLADGLTTPGWFLITAAIADTDIADFVTAAQAWFASSARNGALLSWFTDPAPRALAGWTLFADPAGVRSTVSRLTAIQFGNIAISVPSGTGVVANGDGTALSLSAAGNPIQLTVTPYGARNPVKFAVDGPLAIDLAGEPGTAGCMAFPVSVDGAGLDSLDLGLRCYTAPTGVAGYAQTTRYRPFDFGPNKVTLAAMLDPLAPEDHARSQLGLPGAAAVPSAYRSASGATLTASFGNDFCLVLSARLVEIDARGNPVQRRDPIYTLVPSGTVTLANPAAIATGPGPAGLATTLMGGLSPVEYLAPPAAGATLTFVPDQPAFAATLPPPAASTVNAAAPKARTFGPLCGIATTAWVKIETPAEGAAYYSQPDQAVMHQGDATASQFLSYLPMPIAALVPGSTAAIPLLPYASLVPGGGIVAADLAEFERQVWSPKRVGLMRAAGAAAAKHTQALVAATVPAPPFGTTPQGLLLEFGAANAWQTLTIALNSPWPSIDPPPRTPGLLLRNIAAPLQGALQSNELFLAVTDAAALLANADIGYYLSAERVVLLDGQINDQAASDWLAKKIVGGALGFNDRADFLATIAPASAPKSITDNQDLLCQICGDFSLFAAGNGTDNDLGWEFDLNPHNWSTHQTILIFKFCKTSLAVAAADTSQWSDAATFSPSAAVAAQQIAQIIADARTERATNPDLAYFVDTVVDDPSWTGILALNATVPLAGLPEQMRALAAGIDPAAFQAHHVGVSTTPVTNAAATFTASPSSIFGLINYNDPKALAGTDTFGFKVNSLKVLIANSQVANFSSRVELLINELFGEPATQIGASDNNLGFNGFYQKAQTGTGQIGSYQFVAAQPTAYALTSYVVDQIAITGATFVTLPGTDDQNPTVNAVFMLNGAIAFLPQTGFDAFSFGPEDPQQGIDQGLSYRSLAVRMSFSEAVPNYRTLTFDPSGVVVDPATSLVRSASLVSHFPMKLSGLIAGQDGVTPDSLGFMPVDTPLQGVKLAPPWYGLRFDLDLGTAGALAAEAGFTAGLLLGWAPNANAASIYVGLALPGVSGGQRSISLEGVITLSFGGISFLVAPPTYLLQLSNIALKFLSVSFPSGGQVNLTLFGNPEQQASGALGWLGAYLKNGAGQPKKPPVLLESDA